MTLPVNADDADKLLAQHLQGCVRYLGAPSSKPCKSKWPELDADKSMGKGLPALLPLAQVQSIEIFGDEVRLPSPLVLQALLQGRVARRDVRASGPAHNVDLKFKDGRCLELTFFPVDQQLFHQMRAGEQWCEIPVVGKEAGNWSSTVAAIKPGATTREQLLRLCSEDGGISVPFRSERFIVNGAKVADRVLKINVAFKAAHKEPSGQDVVARVSPVYLDFAYCD
ncbi:MAG: hypothetical protein JSS83_26365 [Cyanobacteria bacterium SZAS LIN-3]|nr:hypothetical protein [Cyanobacteria bacterium SZAS LIN-3]